MKNIKKVERIEKTTIKEYVISGDIYKLFVNLIKTSMVSPQKIKILKFLNDNILVTMDKLEKTFGMSKPLLSYHLNGNLQNTGMFKFGMVNKRNISGGRIEFFITNFGKDILNIIQDDISEINIGANIGTK